LALTSVRRHADAPQPVLDQYPKLHKVAGGTGTYADPITFAAAPNALPAGTVMYVWKFAKYFIMEDECQECIRDWKQKQKYHTDLWIGDDTVPEGGNLVACENALSSLGWVDSATVEVNPSDHHPVNTDPLFDADKNTCSIDAPPCTDHGDTCGNLCQIPETSTCPELEQLLSLTKDRFTQLNPNLDCSGEVKKGTTVCMGGSCGDR
jgi:hypothetical protein